MKSVTFQQKSETPVAVAPKKVAPTKVAPTKIVCVGKNYTDHITEMNSAVPDHMVVFMKPNSAMTQTLAARRGGEALHYETEICLLIDGGDVAGVGVGFDLTKRGLQSKLKEAGLPWERAKAFDGSALFSDFVAAPDSLNDLRLELRVDGELRQQGGCQQMLYPPQIILEEFKSFLTLNNGDIVMTGTPSGVGPVDSGAHYDATLLDGEYALTSVTWTAL